MWLGNGTCCQFSESDLQLFSNLRGIPSLGHSAEYNPVQPLESLPGYKRPIVQTPYPSLHYEEFSSGSSSQITGRFYCIRFPHHPHHVPLFQLSLPSSPSIPHLIRSVPIPTNLQRNLLFPFLKKVHVFPRSLCFT